MNATTTKSDENAVLPVSIGTGIWLVALVVLIARKSELDRGGNAWWIAAAAVGLISGVVGVLYLRRRRARIERATTQE